MRDDSQAAWIYRQVTSGPNQAWRLTITERWAADMEARGRNLIKMAVDLRALPINVPGKPLTRIDPKERDFQCDRLDAGGRVILKRAAELRSGEIKLDNPVECEVALRMIAISRRLRGES